MPITFRPLRQAPLSAPVDLLVLGASEGALEEKSVTQVDRALRGALRRALADTDHKGKLKQRLVLDTLGKVRARRVAVIGMGPASESTAGALHLGAAATRLANQVGAASLTLLLPRAKDEAATLELATRGLCLGGYRFDRYRSDKGRKASLRRVSLGFTDGRLPGRAAHAALRSGEIIAAAVALARDLGNEPASELYPETLARRAQREARAHGLKARVLGPKELSRRRMNLLLGVGAGSARPPRLVHLTYTPAGTARQRPVVLVGKGITFDSGGLSLKSNANMADMKIDMAGAAAVLATLIAAARLRLPLQIHGVLALAENMPSGTALRIGDVLTSAAGKTVEINNTDAEGRLVLADALHFAGSLRPHRLIDVATLTGACVVALGSKLTGLFANDEALASALLSAAEASNETTWRLPLHKPLREQLKSEVADLKNTGERDGGAITAALFLREFVGETPWAHLDIAGPAHSTAEAGILGKGATGVAVATLVELLRQGTGAARRRRDR